MYISMYIGMYIYHKYIYIYMCICVRIKKTMSHNKKRLLKKSILLTQAVKSTHTQPLKKKSNTQTCCVHVFLCVYIRNYYCPAVWLYATCTAAYHRFIYELLIFIYPCWLRRVAGRIFSINK